MLNAAAQGPCPSSGVTLDEVLEQRFFFFLSNEPLNEGQSRHRHAGRLRRATQGLQWLPRELSVDGKRGFNPKLRSAGVKLKGPAVCDLKNAMESTAGTMLPRALNDCRAGSKRFKYCYSMGKCRLRLLALPSTFFLRQTYGIHHLSSTININSALHSFAKYMQTNLQYPRPLLN